ncbi:MAG: glycosyltransferase [Deltaproteobacteria bacterium]|nr:glycosyltransferase [Deltaproteobacteria bacterium]
MLKKVLVAYSSKPPITEYLRTAFARTGVEARAFHADVNHWFDRFVIHHVNKTAHNLRIIPKGKDFFAGHPLSHLQYRSARLVEAVKEFSPDLVLIVRGIKFTEEALKEIRGRSLLFAWWIEREERMEEAFRELRLYDHYFFMSSSCTEAGAQKGLGGISLLHHSVDTSAFYPEEREKKYDWCFVGKWSPKRIEFVERALKVSKNAAIWGPKWIKKNPLDMALRKAVKGAYIEGEDLVRLYGESKVVINVTNWGFGEGEKRSGMNMRVLEVPACRAALLTDGSRDLKTMVTSGKHVVVYDGLDDFGEKLSSLVKNDDERNRIASAGYEHVAKNYTYDHVAGIITERYNAIKGI